MAQQYGWTEQRILVVYVGHILCYRLLSTPLGIFLHNGGYSDHAARIMELAIAYCLWPRYGSAHHDYCLADIV